MTRFAGFTRLAVISILFSLFNFAPVAFADKLETGVYVHFSSSHINWLQLSPFGTGSFKVNGSVNYGNNYYRFSGGILEPSATNPNSWVGKGGGFSVSYNNGSCYFDVVINMYARTDGGFDIAEWAPPSIPLFNHENNCLEARKASGWTAVDAAFYRRYAYFVDGVVQSVPDGDKAGVLRVLDVPRLTTNNNYSAVRVELNLNHPHLGDIHIELTRPDGTVLKTKRVIIDHFCDKKRT